MRVVIAAGGTAGHVVPALAVAEELRKRQVDVHFIGGGRAEKELVPAAGFPFQQLPVEGIDRKNPLKAARAVLKALAALLRSVRLLRRLKPDAVMGGGGYAAGPVGLAAAVLRIPLVLTEADSHIGLTNRLLARFAKRVCLAFPVAGCENSRYLVTGRPLPAVEVDREAARQQMQIAKDQRLLLIFGGSLGAQSINRAATAAFTDPRYRVLHVAGSRDYPNLDSPGEHYQLLEYLPVDEFASALAASDLVIGRSGGSVFELAAQGKPAVLIPYPYASADHQTTNAEWMVNAGAAVLIKDSELTVESLRKVVDGILTEPGLIESMAAASLRLAKPDAAADIASEVVGVAK